MVAIAFLSLLTFSSVGLARFPSFPKRESFDRCWKQSSASSVYVQSIRDGNLELVNSYGSACFPIVPAPNTTNNYHKLGPWTYEPICTEAVQEISSPLCIYTSAFFSNGRGISIFTTPQIAEEIAQLPVFTDPSALPRHSINVDSGAWGTSSLPGRGVGMLAKHLLSHKDRVTAYTPGLLAHLESDLSTAKREYYFRKAVNQLPEATKEMFMGLATVYGDPRIRVQDIVKANTFALYLGGANHLAVFPETSRLNHDCGPNAQYYLDPNLLTHFVHATRPIKPGEEITISYTSPLLPALDRQSHLQTGFHFTCTCRRCTSSSQTDSLLAQMQNLQTTLNDWTPSSSATPQLAKKLISLYKQEGLEGFLDIPYGFAALAYSAVGDKKRAKEFAEKAVDVILLKDGEWSENLKIWREMLDGGVERHWSWRWRVKNRGR